MSSSSPRIRILLVLLLGAACAAGLRFLVNDGLALQEAMRVDGIVWSRSDLNRFREQAAPAPAAEQVRRMLQQQLVRRESRRFEIDTAEEVAWQLHAEAWVCCSLLERRYERALAERKLTLAERAAQAEGQMLEALEAQLIARSPFESDRKALAKQLKQAMGERADAARWVLLTTRSRAQTQRLLAAAGAEREALARLVQREQIAAEELGILSERELLEVSPKLRGARAGDLVVVAAAGAGSVVAAALQPTVAERQQAREDLELSVTAQAMSAHEQRVLRRWRAAAERRVAEDGAYAVDLRSLRPSRLFD